MKDLERFVKVQDFDGNYSKALREIQNGHKWNHWIWFIFPQLSFLGHSHNARYYGIDTLEEARKYMQHPILSQRLREISNALLSWSSQRTISEILPVGIDEAKVGSCMTLFEHICPNDVFTDVLDKLYDSERCPNTTYFIETGKIPEEFLSSE